jgi:flavin reductase (DIM6/NTAB) family NADH-FMN oxidoreductase RutF
VHTSVPSDAFRSAVGEFATGVTVVIVEHEEHRGGMTLNSFTSVALEPPLVLVSLAHSTRTLDLVASAQRFSVSVLQRDQRELAIEFATAAAAFPMEHATRTYDGYVVVKGAASTMQCEVEHVVRAGDHDLVIGRVVGMTHAGGEPLLFQKGRFGGMVIDAAAPPGLAIALDEEGAGW